jgi:hypothetical protein
LFTNVTREPGDTVTWVLLTPEAAMLTVVPPPDGVDGEEGDPPPHDAIAIPITIGTIARTGGLSHASRDAPGGPVDGC